MTRSRHTKRRPRIGVNLLGQMPGEITGTGRYADSLLKALARRNKIDLVLFCPEGRSQFKAEAPVLKIVPAPTLRNIFARTVYEQTLFPAMAARHNIDLLFSPNYVSPLWGPFKRIVTVHDMYPWRIPWSVRLGTRLHRRAMLPASVLCCHAVIAVSENTAKDIREVIPKGRTRVHVIHEACTFDVGKPESGWEELPPPRTQPYILMVANINPNKNIGAVAAAAVRLRERGRACPIYVIGRDPRGLMAHAIEQHGAAGVLVPVGEVGDQTIRAYFRHALCTVHASAYEGFGLPVLEAQALGSPVVCTRRGALPEVAGDGALYFDYGNPAQLAEVIEFLLDNPGEREALALRGRANVKRFSWDRAAEETETLFSQVLGEA